MIQDLDEQINYIQVTKLNSTSDAYISSPLELEPKPNSGWRRIHYLSNPQKNLVYHYILHDYGALEYTGINDDIAVFLSWGIGTIMIKHNLSDAFCHKLILPSNW